MKKQKYKVIMTHSTKLQNSSGCVVTHETTKTETITTDCIENSLEEMLKDNKPDKVKVERI